MWYELRVGFDYEYLIFKAHIKKYQLSKKDYEKFIENYFSAFYEKLLQEKLLGEKTKQKGKIVLTKLKGLFIKCIEYIFLFTQMPKENQSDKNFELFSNKKNKKGEPVPIEVKQRYFAIKFRKYMEGDELNKFLKNIKEDARADVLRNHFSNQEIIDYITGSISYQDKEFLEEFMRQDERFRDKVEMLKEIYLDAGKDEEELHKAFQMLSIDTPDWTPKMEEIFKRRMKEIKKP